MKTTNLASLFASVLIAGAMLGANAQSGYDSVLKTIEANNTTLMALREQKEAQKITNRTGIFPYDPEIEFHYLWGSPGDVGKRTDIAISQSFDFPTAYGYRRKIANLQNANAELAYRAERMGLLLSAKQACVELVYYNALAQENATRLKNAEITAESQQKSFEQGQANILDHNRAQMSLAAAKAEAANIEAERAALLSELRRLNGGKDIALTDAEYPDNELPASFDDWYSQAEAKSPALQYLSGQIQIGQQQIKLNRALNLPKLSVGYMSERVSGGERFHGVTMGMSIPLWENRNRVKEARAYTRAAQSELEDNKVQFYNQLRATHAKAAAMQQTAQQLRESLKAHGNEPLLKRALDAGAISLLEYLLEIEYHYSTVDKVLEAERNYQNALAELSAVEL